MTLVSDYKITDHGAIIIIMKFKHYIFVFFIIIYSSLVSAEWRNEKGGNIFGDSDINPMANPNINPMANPDISPMGDPAWDPYTGQKNENYSIVAPLVGPIDDPIDDPIADPLF